MPQAPLLEVENLRCHFRTADGEIPAVDGVDLCIGTGETVALVGESGCGKSVTALSLARLVSTPPATFPSGRILFRGRDVLEMQPSALRKLRGNEISYVFQDPASSLNPVFRAGYQVEEAFRIHRPDGAGKDEVLRLLQLVGLSNPEQVARRYPHELSGGMQQRVMIAMALACTPSLLVADEPTTALDVTIQAQILALIGSLQKQLGMAVLLITHNLGLVADIAHRVYVMYAGRIVEHGETSALLRRPSHPYTRALLAAVPRLRSTGGRLPGIPGAVPSPSNRPQGCAFHPRCSLAREICRRDEPGLEPAAGGHESRCHLRDEVCRG